MFIAHLKKGILKGSLCTKLHLPPGTHQLLRLRFSLRLGLYDLSVALSQDLRSSFESLVEALRCAGMGRFIEFVACVPPPGAGDSPLEFATLVSLFSSELLHWRSSMSSELELYIKIVVIYSQ